MSVIIFSTSYKKNKIFKSIIPYLILINISVWILLELFGNSKNSTDLIKFGALFGPFVSEGEYWRLFLSIFIHVGIIHLLFNQLAILIFVRLNENEFNNLKLLTIYIFSGLFANLLSYYMTPFNISAGSSGAIFGMAGSYLSSLLFKKPKNPIENKENLLGISIIILVNLFYGLIDSNIDNWAHIGGLISGFITGLFLLKIFNSNSSLDRNKKSIKIIFFITISMLILLSNIYIRSSDLKKNVLTHIFSAEIHAKNDNNEKALKELIIAKEIATKNKDLNTLNDIKNLIQSLNQIEK